MKYYKDLIREEAPTNSIAAGGVPSLSDGSVVPNKARNRWRKNNEAGQLTQCNMVTGLLRRVQPPTIKLEEGTFAGMKTFKVPSYVVENARYHKLKHAHWTKYLGENDIGRYIREYANSHPDEPIILECDKTGYMVFARYGKSRRK